MKIAIITGASTGIGRATAIAFAKAGYKVYLVARSQEKLEETQKQAGENTVIAQTDLADIKSVNALIERIKQNETRVDAIVNIAGIWHDKNEVFADKDYQTFDQQVIVDTYTVGFTAPSLIIHGLLPLMPAKSKIVNLSGTFQDGGKGWLPYFASKRAIEDLTVGLAQELEDKDIQVNAVSPSDSATEEYAKYFPEYMNDAIAPEKIADQILNLCDDSNTTSGKIFVMQKNKKPIEAFHY